MGFRRALERLPLGPGHALLELAVPQDCIALHAPVQQTPGIRSAGVTD